MAGGDLCEFTDGNFEQEVLRSDQPVVVDFTAPWCGPCKVLGPIIQELAAEFKGTVRMGRLNVDDNPQTASKYGIISIPTILFVNNGSVVEQHVGLLAKEPLRAKIEQFAAS